MLQILTHLVRLELPFSITRLTLPDLLGDGKTCLAILFLLLVLFPIQTLSPCPDVVELEETTPRQGRLVRYILRVLIILILVR